MRPLVESIIAELLTRHRRLGRVDLNDIAEVVNARAVSYDEIDHIIARLEAEGLQPSPVADRTTLVRRLHLDLESTWNGRRAGLCNAGEEMTFHFGQLIAHLCKTRNARAGSIFGSGTVSNKDWSHGYSCIAEKRAIETIETGSPQTAFMRFGDTIRIEMKSAEGRSIFGAIDQKVTPLVRS